MVVITNGGSELQAMPNPGDNTDGKDEDYERNSPVTNRETPLRRSAFRAMVQDFGPIWFTWLVFHDTFVPLSKASTTDVLDHG